MNRGQRLQEILKQPQYEPMSLEHEVIILFAGTNGFADQIPVEKMRPGSPPCCVSWKPAYPEIGQEMLEEKADHTRNRRRNSPGYPELQFILGRLIAIDLNTG